MSKRAETLVWERARAKGSNLLVLVRLGDCADDDGRDAWPGLKRLAAWCRLTERALRYILHKLERDGEIVIDLNTDGRHVLIGRRRFHPEWFIHLRCVFDWEAYQLEPESENFSSSHFPKGRKRRGPVMAKFSDSAEKQSENISAKSEAGFTEIGKNTYGGYIGIDPLVDPLVEQEQGAAPPPLHETRRRTDDDDPNFRVILKTAHDAIDIEGVLASDADLKDTVKSLCCIRNLNFGSNGDLVNKAIDAARWQRTRPRPEVSA